MFRRRTGVSKRRFSIGQPVRILDKEAIAATLDSNRKLDGCLFMEQMWEYCGRTCVILKIPRYLHNNDRLLRCKTPVYMLEGVMCNGKSDAFDKPCDRSCYLLWHDRWLGPA